jgi:hypothetical protein
MSVGTVREGVCISNAASSGQVSSVVVCFRPFRRTEGCDPSARLSERASSLSSVAIRSQQSFGASDRSAATSTLFLGGGFASHASSEWIAWRCTLSACSWRSTPRSGVHWHGHDGDRNRIQHSVHLQCSQGVHPRSRMAVYVKCHADG